MIKRAIGFFCMIFFACIATGRQARKPDPPTPDQFLIGRHIFFDFGPPFDFYEVFSISSAEKGSSIEKITVTPGAACMQAATLELETASISESVSDLLGRANPCTIPEKELRRELKRCKRCLVFSGADITLQVKCGDQTRRIRMDILDRDMFDPAPKTPHHTSWTMVLMSRLDKAFRNGIMQRPAFAVSELPNPPAINLNSKAIEDLKRGKFDALFEKASHKPSDLFRAAQSSPPAPSVKLVSSSPFRPVYYELPTYPPLARLANIAGQVVFTLDVTSDGSVSNLRILSGQVMLQKIVKVAITSWKFPNDAAGRQIVGTLEFQTNCPPTTVR